MVSIVVLLIRIRYHSYVLVLVLCSGNSYSEYLGSSDDGLEDECKACDGQDYDEPIKRCQSSYLSDVPCNRSANLSL